MYGSNEAADPGGEQRSVDAVVAELSAYRTRVLRVSHAFHSADLDGMLEPFRVVAQSLTYRKPTCAVVSGLTGQLASADDLMAPEYWVRQVREAVRFADVMQVVEQQRLAAVVECGPSAVLTAMALSAAPQRR